MPSQSQVIILKQPYRNLGSQFECLADFQKRLNEIYSSSCHKNIELSFQNIQFVYPIYITTIFASLHNKGLNVTVTNATFDVHSYLETIFFEKEFAVIEDTNFEYYNSKRYSPILCIPRDNPNSSVFDSLVQKINELLYTVISAETKQKQTIGYILSEMYDNVKEHAESTFCYTMYQYYPSDNELEICLIDNGIGLKESYARHGEFQVNSHREAVLQASKGISTKNNEGNRGHGIISSSEITNHVLQGTFMLQSGNALFVKSTHLDDPTLIEFKPNQAIESTLVAIRVKTERITNNRFERFYSYL